MTRISSPVNKLTSPHEAMSRLWGRLSPLGSEHIALKDAVGRVLAEPLLADRPSPACDVSAMDGYAVRTSDLQSHSLPIAGEVIMGHKPPALLQGVAMRIFTGGAIPGEAQAVIPREQVHEANDHIDLPAELTASPGQYIRRRGENAPAGEIAVEAGQPITTCIAAAMANFGLVQPRVVRRVRVSVIITGNEVLPPDAKPDPWQLRDANTSALCSLFTPFPWLTLHDAVRVPDRPETLSDVLRTALTACDAVILTGGVSMGDYDHVPDVINALGGEIIFHRLALRPGKPLLGAIASNGQLIFGLPGNPVSALTTTRRFVVPALRKLAGWRNPDPPVPAVQLTNADSKTLDLWWYRLVRLTSPSHAELVSTKSSGDLVAAARSDGFIEIPPNTDASDGGPWPFYDWATGNAR